MTLGERLEEKRIELGISKTALLKMLSLGKKTIEAIYLDDKYTQKIAKKIADKLGPEFDEYVTCSICKHCGKEYYASRYKQDYCGTTCHNKDEKRVKYREVSCDVRIKRKKQQQGETAEQFEARARSRHLSYGELQKQERLSMVIR